MTLRSTRLASALLAAACWPLVGAAADSGHWMRNASGNAMRDPMQAPPAALALRTPTATDAAPPALAPAPAPPRQLIVIDGRRYVVEGTRRRGVGDLLDGARIERIDDAAVIVRQGQTTQRLPLFGKVIKQAAAEPGRTDKQLQRPGDMP